MGHSSLLASAASFVSLTCQLLQLFTGKNDARVSEVLFWFDLFSQWKTQAAFQLAELAALNVNVQVMRGSPCRCVRWAFAATEGWNQNPSAWRTVGRKASKPCARQRRLLCLSATSLWGKRCDGLHRGHVEYEGWQSGKEQLSSEVQ